jgi:hypothetical protein
LNAVAPVARPAERPRRLLGSPSPTFWALLFTALVIAAPNLPGIVGLVHTSPIYLQSGLSTVPASGHLAGQPSIDPNDGFVTQALSRLSARDLLGGIVPWWNPFEGVGAPLAGEMQAASFFPLVLLFALGRGILFFHLALELLAGGFTVLFLRRLGVGAIAATVGGIAFGLNGSFAWIGNSVVNPIAFLPLVLWGIELARDQRGRTGRWGVIVTALGLALSIYAGFPETAALDGLFAGFWLLLRLRRLPRSSALKLLARGASAAAAALMLAAPLLVAFVDYLAVGDIGPHAGGYAHAQLPAVALSLTLVPYSLGPIFAFYTADPSGHLLAAWANVGGYLPTSVLALALTALGFAWLGRRERWLRFGLLLWVALFLGRSFGVPVFTELVNSVPGMADVMVYRYAAPSWEMAAVILAALGLEDVCRLVPDRRLVVAVLVGLALAAGAAAAAAAPVVAGMRGATHLREYVLGSAVAALLAGGGVVAILAKAAFSGSQVGRFGVRLLAALVVGEVLLLFALPSLSAPRKVHLDMGPVRFLDAHLGLYRFVELGAVNPNYGTYFGLSEVNVNDLPIPRSYARFISRELDTNTSPLLFTGYSQTSSSGPSAAQEVTAHLAQYEAIGVRYLVAPAQVALPAVADQEGIKVAYQDSRFDIYQLPHPVPFFHTIGGRCAVRAVDWRVAHVSCAGPATLVRDEQWLPGWSVRTGGGTLAVGRQGALFQAVRLAPGSATVTYSYAPPGEGVGVLLALLAGLGLAALGFAVPLRRSGEHSHMVGEDQVLIGHGGPLP